MISEQTLEKVKATFAAYLMMSDYPKQYRDEIIAKFEQYIKWMNEPPGGEDGAKVLTFRAGPGKGA